MAAVIGMFDAVELDRLKKLGPVLVRRLEHDDSDLADDVFATNTAAKPEPQHPPLARDTQGNLVAIPDGTTAWRICRQTTGRPKELVGPDKRTLRFPLEMTVAELADLCGADVYRVYALDEVGTVLDYVATVDVTREMRELRNAAPDAQLSQTLRTTSAAPTSDLRFALEAIVQMMRVNGEALRAVSESQADWVKSIASLTEVTEDPIDAMRLAADLYSMSAYRAERDYILSTSDIALPTKHHTVHAGDELRIDMTITSPIKVVVDGATTCDRLSLRSNDGGHEVLSATPCSEPTFWRVAPGEYQLCADAVCDAITVASISDIQHIHVPH